MIFLGIDPGLKGSVACLNPHFTDVPWVAPLPFNGSTLDILALVATLNTVTGGQPAVLTLERVQLRRANAGNLTSGANYGLIIGACHVAECIRILHVDAARWKRSFKLGNSKLESIALAKDRFPSVLSPKRKHLVMTDGDAEALLLAQYGQDRFHETVGIVEGLEQ